eukprot:m.30384 g.30384  ORF g.30384 m.30384 type:complete len:521 (-) comp9429_c0_seq1:123-1685(-)
MCVCVCVFAAVTWSSGLAGTHAVLQLLRPADHVVALDDLYGGSSRMFHRLAEPAGLQFSFVPMSGDLHELRNALRPDTKLVWLETPTNPLMQVSDIQRIAELVHAMAPGCIVAVDNTFMSPYRQRPLALGADIEFDSVTKYINGHSDVVMGVTMTNSDSLHKRLRFLQFAAGAIPSPFDCFLVNRGLKTLHVRMEAHSANATAVAQYLEAHPAVESVLFPGLESHPGHALHQRQTTGDAGMLSFRVRGGLAEAKAFLSAVQVFILAESLGCVESLAEHPAIMTHASIPPDERARLGITDNLVRLSVGIEDKRDLLLDLQQALERAVPGAYLDVAPFVSARGRADACGRGGEKVVLGRHPEDVHVDGDALPAAESLVATPSARPTQHHSHSSVFSPDPEAKPNKSRSSSRRGSSSGSDIFGADTSLSREPARRSQSKARPQDADIFGESPPPSRPATSTRGQGSRRTDSNIFGGAAPPRQSAEAKDEVVQGTASPRPDTASSTTSSARRPPPGGKSSFMFG